MSSFIPYGRHTIDEDDITAVVKVLQSDYLTTGPIIPQFEIALAKAVEATEAVAVANGTAALHLAYLAIGLGPGDVAVLPSVTFLATASAVRLTGAEVWFADVDPKTGLAGLPEFSAALEALDKTPKLGKAKLIVPVHLNGQTKDCLALYKMAKELGLWVIEDACHALGTVVVNNEYTTYPVGSALWSDAACFSFHPVKTIAMAEGGAVTTRNSTLAEKIRILRNHGMQRNPDYFGIHSQAFAEDGSANPWYYEMNEPGFNYRASDLQGALGLSQLSKLTKFAAKRQALTVLYDRLLNEQANQWKPIERTPDCQPVFHLYAVQTSFGNIVPSRANVMSTLQKKGIGTQVHYLPVNRQPYYRNRYGLICLPGANEYYESVLSLPLFPGLDQEDVLRVVSALSAFSSPSLHAE